MIGVGAARQCSAAEQLRRIRIELGPTLDRVAAVFEAMVSSSEVRSAPILHEGSMRLEMNMIFSARPNSETTQGGFELE